MTHAASPHAPRSVPTVRIRFASALLGLLAATPLALPPAHAARAWSPTFTATALWHDNVTNADTPTDILAALQTVAEVAGSHRVLLGRNDSLLLGARAFADTWSRYDGLDRTGLSTQLTWQHKLGLGPYAPTFRAELAADLFAAREPDRAGQAGTATLLYRQRFAAIMRFQFAHTWSRTDARSLAFDRTGQETSLQLARQFGDAWELTLAVRRRHGTVLAYSSPPRPDLLAKGKILTLSTTFDRATPLVAYYFDARTVACEFRATRSLGPRLDLVLTAELRDTTHGNASYQNRLASASLVRSF